MTGGMSRHRLKSGVNAAPVCAVTQVTGAAPGYGVAWKLVERLRFSGFAKRVEGLRAKNIDRRLGREALHAR